MSIRRNLKLIHFASTAWFILCIGYMLVFTLRQAGFHWWFIFSLSGHSVVIVFLLISLYLFAIFKGVRKSAKIIEHPITCTNYYMFLYDVFPFVGMLAGLLVMMGTSKISQFFLGIALGTLGATFFGWIVIDPIMGMIEILLPESRKHRLVRLARAKALQKEKHDKNKELLTDVLTRDKFDRQRWSALLMPQAERLAEIITAGKVDFQTQCEVGDIGVKSLQTGGLSCMQQLHDMTIDLCKKNNQDKIIIDYISTWWDGIGNWHSPCLNRRIIFT